MNKIAVYLSQHLSGEVSSAQSLRKLYSTDGSILSIAPEIIAFPRITNDVRKVARFTWQLAEKGHIVGITARGFGGDATGASIGKGIVIDMSKQLNSIIEIATKDKLIHVQPGASLATIDDTLKWQGLMLPGARHRGIQNISVGGAIANDSLGDTGRVSDTIKKLEVVLANGDILETGKLNKREVSKKLGLQTFEGEIYRKIEGLLEDNEELIKQIAADTTRDNTGYKRIAEVRTKKDGSFNLTPLFVGSQGTLGIISEAVLRAEFYSVDETHAVVVASSVQTARDLSERLLELEPTELRVIDGTLLRRAAKNGSSFTVLGSVEQTGAIVYIRFNDFSVRAQDHKLKKLKKLLKKLNMAAIDSTERDPEDFRSITGLTQTLQLSSSDDNVAMSLINGVSIPANRAEEFELAVGELAGKHHIELPLELDILAGTYNSYPLLSLDSVADKQKIFKLITDYATLVDKCGGAVTADGAEGRLKANASWAVVDEAHARLYEQVRAIFDPFGTLNPGVKQTGELRTLVGALRSSYDAASVL
ncbi:MAG: FAD-binding oxidoreductase [Candidatus Saccharimonadaceae bacterium]